MISPGSPQPRCLCIFVQSTCTQISVPNSSLKVEKDQKSGMGFPGLKCNPLAGVQAGQLDREPFSYALSSSQASAG